MLQEIPTWLFFSNTTYAPTEHLHQRQIIGFSTFTQTWSVRRWARGTEMVNL